jgi:hypothetical protein
MTRYRHAGVKGGRSIVPTHSWPRLWMGMSGQRRAPAALYSRDRLDRRLGRPQNRSGHRGSWSSIRISDYSLPECISYTVVLPRPFTNFPTVHSIFVDLTRHSSVNFAIFHTPYHENVITDRFSLMHSISGAARSYACYSITDYS